jgi:hypothetical protein
VSSSSHLDRTALAVDTLRRKSELRVTDAERERAAERIRTAYGVGALTHDELDDRLTLAFAARTRGDLSRLTRDLPRDGSRRDAMARAGLRWHAASYLAVNGGLVVTWAATGGPFWPAGSIGPWGTGLALHAYGVHRARRARARKQLPA